MWKYVTFKVDGKINELYSVKSTWHGKVYFITSLDLDILNAVLSIWFVKELFIIVKSKQIQSEDHKFRFWDIYRKLVQLQPFIYFV